MFFLYWAAAGFCTVFGWDAGQNVWDRYIEPHVQIEQPADSEKEKSKR